MASFTTAWNAAYQAAPDGSIVDANTLDTVVSTLKEAIKARVGIEHNFDLANDADQGTHKAGSAMAYYQSTTPTTRPNGDTLDTDDRGRIFMDSSNDGALYSYTSDGFIQGTNLPYGSAHGTTETSAEMYTNIVTTNNCPTSGASLKVSGTYYDGASQYNIHKISPTGAFVSLFLFNLSTNEYTTSAIQAGLGSGTHSYYIVW